MDWKKLLLIAVVGCFCSCTENKYKRTEDDRYIEVKKNNFAKYIEFDGHEYVIYREGSFDCATGSMCHSPKCPCLKDYKK